MFFLEKIKSLKSEYKEIHKELSGNQTKPDTSNRCGSVYKTIRYDQLRTCFVNMKKCNKDLSNYLLLKSLIPNLPDDIVLKIVTEMF